MNFVVLSSSRGTVFRATLERIQDGTLKAKCLGLIADKKTRGCVAIAEEFSVPVLIVEKKKGEERAAYDKRVNDAIALLGKADAVACMGWMFILSPWFIEQWRNKILNVHPALLPKHPGAHAHELVLAAKETESGMTIHLIDEGVDTGTTLIQKKCPVLPDDTVDTLKARVQKLECEWYPKTLQMIVDGVITL